MRRLLRFLEDRSGLWGLVARLADEPVPGGARWAYVFGSALVVVLGIQAVTGAGLMLTYSPSASMAWGSVSYIQDRVSLGWLLRGMHRYGADAMMVVLGLHLLQVFLYGAYKAPRELNWWAGLIMLALVQALALTGYLLPWDQKGYWATRVTTSIISTVPIIGSTLERIIVGGNEYGTATLTRFYTAHVAILPSLLFSLVALHIYLFRRHGVTAPARADVSLEVRFFPEQIARDIGAGLIVMLAVVSLAVAGHGVSLDAPADPGSDYPARPEWYFLFLFELLKYFEGPFEVVGTTVLPLMAFGFLFALPLLDRARDRSVRARLPWVGVVLAGALVMNALTASALIADARDDELQAALVRARARADRARQLARRGIPVQGASELLRRDPQTGGPELFGEHCAQCHRVSGRGGDKASDLGHFGSRRWIFALARDPQHPSFFGHTKHRGMEPQTDLGDSMLYAIATFLQAQGAGPSEPRDMTRIPAGERGFRDRCMDCHLFAGQGRRLGLADGPELKGYGSVEWIRGQILHPEAPSRYGATHEMPSFADRLEPEEVEVLVQFLRQERAAGVATR